MASLTEREILGQHQALARTCEYFLDNAGKIKKFAARQKYRSLAFIGCGSSYCQCRSAELSARMRLPVPAVSIAGGDLMLNYRHYRELLKGAMLVAPTRSGSTSEVLIPVQRLKRDLKSRLVLVCCREKSELGEIADLALTIPWAFDKSACQTRSVTCIYAANLCLVAALANDRSLFREIGLAVSRQEKFMAAHREMLRAIGSLGWRNALVLADSELEGIAGSAALSIKEIALCPADYSHLLDVRHGPVLMVNDRTLVILAASSSGNNYQKDLVADLKKRGATVVTFGPKSLGGDYHLAAPAYQNFGVAGIPFIFGPQLIACCKAARQGLNPDQPHGLQPWIVLNKK